MSGETWIYLPYSKAYADMSKFIMVKESDEPRYDKGEKVRLVFAKTNDQKDVVEFIREDAEAVMRYVQGLME